MLKKLGGVVALALVVLGLFISRQPAEFVVTRSAVLSAPAPVLFALVNDFHQWERWSPWAKMDPTAKNTLSGNPSGVGAAFAWEGNNQVGSGRMEITESHPSDLLRLTLDFTKPMKAHNTTEFTFKPEGTGTRVTWTMSGHNNFIGKAVGLVMDCDKMVGGQFEQGLKNMEQAAAATSPAPKKK